MATTGAAKMRAQPAVDPQRLHEVTAAAAAFYAGQLPGHQPAMDYLRSRGINQAAAPGSPWQVGYAPPAWRGLLNHLAPWFTIEEQQAAGLLTYNRNGGLIDRFRDRIVFPVTDHTGAVAGFTARDLSGRDRAPKWVNSPDTAIYDKSKLLYGLGAQLAHRPPGQATPLVVVVEGAADALAVWRMAHTMPHLPNGIPIYAVAPCGTNLTAEQLQLLQDHLPAGSRLAVALDGDPAGRSGFLRAYPMLRDWPDRAWAMTLPAGHDPASMLADLGPDAALAEMARNMAPASRTALTFRLDQLIASGRITRPREDVEDRVLAIKTIAPFFTDDPHDATALAQAAGNRLGFPEGVVSHLVIEHLFRTDMEQLAAARPEQYIASQAVTDWLYPHRRPADDHASPPGDPHQRDQAEPRAAQAQTPDQQPPESAPEPEAAAEPELEPVEVDREELPPQVSWVSASHHRRWPATGAAEHSIDHATGRWAWALADGIGERPQAPAAAETAARIAAQTAARANPAAAIAAAGAALPTNPAAGKEDAAITVATAHPTTDGATRVDLAWSGNIRAYALLGEQVIQVTRDHTVAQQRRDAGQRVTADSPLHHLLTSSVRHGPVSRTSIELPPGGALLLCTPGAYRNLHHTWLRQALRATADPQATIDRLLSHTAKGDNATAMLLRTPAADTGLPPAGQPARLARLAGAATPAAQAPQTKPATDTSQLIAALRTQLAEGNQHARAGTRR